MMNSDDQLFFINHQSEVEIREMKGLGCLGCYRNFESLTLMVDFMYVNINAHH
jgi:hypothetical protein